MYLTQNNGEQKVDACIVLIPFTESLKVMSVWNSGLGGKLYQNVKGYKSGCFREGGKGGYDWGSKKDPVNLDTVNFLPLFFNVVEYT